jgi:predicted RNA polymerase sigma factor
VNEGEASARGAAEAVARRSYGRLVAFLAARTRDVAAAEDALSEAFAAALADWPARGAPPLNPEAWLLTVARRKLIDASRRHATREAAGPELELWARELEQAAAAVAEGGIPDRRLGLMFACAHPSIETGVRAPLMLQAVLGLDAATIASALLVSPQAMSKRLVRAKGKIRTAGIPFRLPGPEELPGRLADVLDAVYAAFTEGWSDAAGSDLARRDLAGEALYLARLTADLLPGEPEALGLLALLLHTEARHRARRSADGEFVPLADQDEALWDRSMIEEAERLIRRASERASLGRYQLEAALQSAHVHRRLTGESNWPEVLRLYDALLALTASPVVAVNRALALAEVAGPSSGLAALPTTSAEPRLAEYQPYWAARAELLARSGARAEARAACERAIGLEHDPAVRRFLQRRLTALAE